jgi:hypothetical protein
MGKIIRFPRRHSAASAGSAFEALGRGTSVGHGAAGQCSENQSSARSSRRTWMSAPPSIAASFLPSSKARELTVVSGMPSSAAYARATDSKCSMLLIPEISVNLPGLSTAILPDAKSVGSGHLTGMDLTAVLSNIEARLAELDKSADAVSRAAGKPDAIRNLRRAIKSGKGGFTMKTLVALARALETSPEALLSTSRPHLPADLDGDAAKMLDFLLEQRELLDNQIRALTARAVKKRRKRRAA